MNSKSFDWRVLQRFMSPQAANDLNDFIERLPQNAGKYALTAAATAWMAAGVLGVFATMEIKDLTAMRAKLAETKALLPPVPKIDNVPVPQADVAAFAAVLAKVYPGLTVKQQGSAVYISTQNTANFGQFREALGHVQNGGQGWRVSVDKLCVGRECKQDKLAALLKINKVSIDKPEQK